MSFSRRYSSISQPCGGWSGKAQICRFSSVSYIIKLNCDLFVKLFEFFESSDSLRYNFIIVNRFYRIKLEVYKFALPKHPPSSLFPLSWTWIHLSPLNYYLSATTTIPPHRPPTWSLITMLSWCLHHSLNFEEKDQSGWQVKEEWKLLQLPIVMNFENSLKTLRFCLLLGY